MMKTMRQFVNIALSVLGLVFLLNASIAQANQAVANIPLTANVESSVSATCTGYVSLGLVLVGEKGSPSEITCVVSQNQPNASIRVDVTPNSEEQLLNGEDTTVAVSLVNARVDKGYLSGSFREGFVIQKVPVGQFTFRTTVQLPTPLTSKTSAGNYSVPINILFTLLP
jgi:hypothetical protein